VISNSPKIGILEREMRKISWKKGRNSEVVYLTCYGVEREKMRALKKNTSKKR
jgi:hypothetical protein